MELGEGEAQICRLCGQYESIYIDVFGEEGTKRLLGLKIHTKINILIKENDGLPQIVCLRCLGTLEFLCDFYERCHITQTELSEASKDETEKKFERESDTESDKENDFPATNDGKRKIKVSSPDASKNCLANACKTERKDESDAAHRVDELDCANDLQALVSKRRRSTVEDKPAIGDVVAFEKRTKNVQNEGSNVQCKTGLTQEKGEVSKSKTICDRKPGKMMNSSQRIGLNGSVESERVVRRKRGRKSKLEKMMDASLAKKGEFQTNFEDPEHRYNRHCLRAICTNAKSNVTNNSVILSKLQVEQREQVVLTELRAKSNGDEESNDLDDGLRRTEERTVKSKPISVIVKQEKIKTESVCPKTTEKENQLDWIPNGVLSPIEKTQRVQRETTLPLTKRAKNSENNFAMTHDVGQSDVSTSSHDEEERPTLFVEQNRVTVIKSSQTNENVVSDNVENDSDELHIATETTNESLKDDLEGDVSDQSFSRRPSRDSSLSGSKSKDKFCKISELISDEQKQVIETYYTVDMSIVNSEEVQKNLTIVDKKNIRCNICNSLYLRMDKCQVHIWGHLKMKPYRCKACDFSTVTVSNVRCHIRKSHLKIKPFACDLCDKRYVTAVLLEEHINTHTGARPYKCKICGFASASRQMLNYHNTTHKTIKDVSCKICGKEFYSRGRLRAHMIIHNKDKVVRCKICSVYLSSTEALETHQRNIHTRDYVCNVCSKRVKSRKALHNHQNVHAAAKYKCSLCPNVYKSSQILKEHLLKHEGIRKYKCNVCEKSFGQQSHLAAHMAVHSEVRFHCPGCNKAFNRHDNMKIHTKRCKPFLANPDLKDLLIKKEKTASFGKMELTDDPNSEDMSNFVPDVHDQQEETLMNIEDNAESTGMNFCKLGLNISCIEPADKTWSRNDVYKETGEMTSSAEINVIQIANLNSKFIPETENLMVIETVLGPQSF